MRNIHPWLQKQAPVRLQDGGWGGGQLRAAAGRAPRDLLREQGPQADARPPRQVIRPRSSSEVEIKPSDLMNDHLIVSRVLALLDQHFQKQCRPNILSVQRTEIVDGESYQSLITPLNI